jgi:hypothetical protein
MFFQRLLIISLFVIGTSNAGLFPQYVRIMAFGIKIGYDFGKNNGLTLGGETNINLLSFTDIPKWAGINVSLEKNLKQDQWRFRQEVIGGVTFGGLGVGGEFFDSKYSFSSRLIFHGFFGYLSYKMPLFKTYSNLHFGAQLPIMLYDNNLRIGF